MRNTKIIATVGPATSSDAAIRDLVEAGVDIFRLNFSHGTHESHAQVVAKIRGAAAAAGRCTAILQDLSGPKIRTGAIRGGTLELVPGEALTIGVGDFIGEPGRVSTAYGDLARSVQRGSTLLLDDGRIQLRVESSDGREVRTVVVHGGPLGEHKGINAPGAPLPAVGLTAKDADDLTFGVGLGVDFMALSFVQTAADMRQARAALERAGAPDLPLIAKFERPEAIAHLDDIAAASDGLMVARGDLGLELPLQQVPRVQKEITRKGGAAGVPVIVATQVLESMRFEPRPTRAEVSDAANAVDDGVDAIMLAGETAVGQFPLAAVRTLDAIIREAETIPAIRRIELASESRALSGHGRALCEAALTLAEKGGASAIVAMTHGGKTARLLSALRPRAPIYAATDQPDIARRLAMYWGVTSVETDLGGDVETAAGRIGGQLVARGAVPAAGVIVVVSINPDLTREKANFLKLQRVG